MRSERNQGTLCSLHTSAHLCTLCIDITYLDDWIPLFFLIHTRGFFVWLRGKSGYTRRISMYVWLQYLCCLIFKSIPILSHLYVFSKTEKQMILPRRKMIHTAAVVIWAVKTTYCRCNQTLTVSNRQKAWLALSPSSVFSLLQPSIDELVLCHDMSSIDLLFVGILTFSQHLWWNCFSILNCSW